jgi:Ca2+/Na+ antiporter
MGCTIPAEFEHISPGPLLGIDYLDAYCHVDETVFIILLMIWIFVLLNTLGSTAASYLSPTLARISEQLNLSYDVAGVTFLAFGNGSPDIFSSLISFSESEATRLIGLNAMLGGSIFVCTVVVSSVAILSPCDVNKNLFVRDISFYLLSVLILTIISFINNLYLLSSAILLLIYLFYVFMVLVSSHLEKQNLKVGMEKKSKKVPVFTVHSLGDRNIREIEDALPEMKSTMPKADVQQAFWYRLDEVDRHRRAKKSSPSNSNGKKVSPDKSVSDIFAEVDSSEGYKFLLLDEEDEDNNRKNGSSGKDSNGTAIANGDVSEILRQRNQNMQALKRGDFTSNTTDTDKEKEDDEEEGTTINLSGLGSSFNGTIIADYIPRPDFKAYQQFVDLGSIDEDEMERLGGGTDRDMDFAPSLMWHLFTLLYPTSSNNNRLSTSRPGWRAVPTQSPLVDSLLDEHDIENAEFDRDIDVNSTMLSMEHGDMMEMKTPQKHIPNSTRFSAAPGSALEAEMNTSRPKSTLDASLYWQQWFYQRRIRRQMAASHFFNLPWHMRIAFLLEWPTVFLRDISIPTLENANWYKPYAIVHPLGIAILVMWVFMEISWQSFFTAILISILPSIGLYLITHNRKPPSAYILKTLWVLAAFFTCILWIYLLAGELIICLEVLGFVWSVPSAYLGLTILAWGLCVGDLFSISSLAKKGLGEMALAGCYGGPVFNLLFGFSLAVGYACLNIYPHPFHIRFNASAYVSLLFLFITLLSSLAVVYLRNWRLDRAFGYFLLSLYVVYMAIQAILVANGW